MGFFFASVHLNYLLVILFSFHLQIVMSYDLGDGYPLRVESHNLPSQFALCDNRWHNVWAMYDSEEIALRIDNQQSIKLLAQNNKMGEVMTKSPLYIGGLPGKFFFFSLA